MTHRPRFRRLSRFGSAGIWSIGCDCGWLVDHPLRGDRERALDAWRAHKNAAATEVLARSMTHVPRGRKD